MTAPSSRKNGKESTRIQELLRQRKAVGVGPGVMGREAGFIKPDFRRSISADWRELTRGDSVVLLNSRHEAVGGVVDDISGDGSLIWIQQDDGAGRRLFHRSDGYKTLLDADARAEEDDKCGRQKVRREHEPPS